MSHRWDIFARNNALYHIDPSVSDHQMFWKKGEDGFHKYILPILKRYQVLSLRAMDFGCGVGRYTFPMSRYFQKVYGVDVSEVMVKMAYNQASIQGISSVDFLTLEPFFSFKEKIDFIYSVNVFQHIEDWEHIERILLTMSQFLSGYAYLQFDTRLGRRMLDGIKFVPDFFLPLLHRRGMRRISRKSQDIRDLALKLNFTILEEQHPDSASHFFLFYKSS